jgi:hypothetical protein
MKRLAVASIVAGMVVGQAFNGPATEAVGVYLVLLAALLIVFRLVVLSGGES